MATYLYSHRPPGIGCQPDGWTDRETWLPAKIIGHRYFFGRVEYDGGLSFETVSRYELWPKSELERAEMVFWREDLDWLRESYLTADEALLQEHAPTDVKARAALVIRAAQKEAANEQ